MSFWHNVRSRFVGNYSPPTGLPGTNVPPPNNPVVSNAPPFKDPNVSDDPNVPPYVPGRQIDAPIYTDRRPLITSAAQTTQIDLQQAVPLQVKPNPPQPTRTDAYTAKPPQNNNSIYTRLCNSKLFLNPGLIVIMLLVLLLVVGLLINLHQVSLPFFRR